MLAVEVGTNLGDKAWCNTSEHLANVVLHGQNAARRVV